MSGKLIEYLRLGRIFNAEILGIILVLSYVLTATLSQSAVDNTIIVMLFFSGILMHVWGSYNNDRMDLLIDEKAEYCRHKPLVSGSISIRNAKIIEYICLLFSILFIISIFVLENGVTFFLILSQGLIALVIYLFLAFFFAFIYNKYNKSNMVINIVGQIYSSFIVLLGMSIVIPLNYIMIIVAIIIGLNGIYLNIIEADIKDIEADVVNVPKALGVTFKGKKAINIKYFYMLNELIKVSMFLLIIYILNLEKSEYFIYFLASIFFIVNFIIRLKMFKIISSDREKIKPYIALQELTSIIMISTTFMIVNLLLPLIIFLFISVWLIVWNKILWGTYLRPQI